MELGKSPLQIDLNEAPPNLSPRETLNRNKNGDGGSIVCRSCGKGAAVVEGGMLVCVKCGRGFHMKCMGTKQKQADWICFNCLFSGGSTSDSGAWRGRGGGVERLLDMNAPPPEEEDVRSNHERVQNDEGKQASCDTSFLGQSSYTPTTYSNFLFMENGNNFHRASHSVTLDANKLGLEVSVHHRLNHRIYEEPDLRSRPEVRLVASHCAPPTYCPPSASEIYLQALKEYIFERKGLLGDDWHVEFDYCPNRCKTSAVYCAPDGSRFESMSAVARRFGLETERTGNGFAVVHKGPIFSPRRKEATRYLGTCINNRETRNTRGSSFPVQFEDLFIISVGKVDPRPSYHDSYHIWPVGYKSCWHDRISGSLFECDVSDGGDTGPIFKVQRSPCSTQPIPSSSTVISRMDVGLSTRGIDDDGDNMSILMMLTEWSPPHLDDDNLSCSRQRTSEDSDFHEDGIGIFAVEGRSSSSVWKMVSQRLVHACRKAYQQTGVIQFCCEHDLKGNVKETTSFDSLSRFSISAGPVNIPHIIQSSKELDSYCEMLVKWVQQDRFGLDVDFVQELLEQLPEVSACSEYIFLNRRCQNSILQTVGGGFLLAKRMGDAQSNSNGFFKSYSGLNKQLTEHTEIKRHRLPLGNPVSSKLPAYLIGDLLQVWEFSQRFSEFLELEEPFSFQELESELINPWLERSRPPVEKPAIGVRGDDISKCTGVLLTKAHSSLLKVLIGEMLFKAAAHVDPNFDAGEIKSKRGRKKDIENSVITKRTKVDMLPVNELTWPELARRYILAVLSMDGNSDSAEITFRESGKVFHCLQGDGGTLCGSLTGVAAMEADALLLAEASKQIFGSVKRKDDVYTIDQKNPDAADVSDMMKEKDNDIEVREVPDWAQVLQPVRKLPTNVGARLRKCVYAALELNPPEWAKKILEYSISKEVYKGNASGPTKRAVVSVLDDARCEKPDYKPEKKEKKRIVSILVSDLLMKQCRLVLRQVVAEDEDKVFCNLLGRTLLDPNDNDDEGLLGYPAMVSCPLDFRTIDLRLAAGTYGGSHEAFLEDVHEVWHNIRKAYRDRSDWIDLAETLLQKFEALYEKEVLTLADKITETANNPNILSDETKKEIDDIIGRASEGTLPKAPWEEGICKVCGMDKDDDNVLLCDSCDSEYHTYCLNPPLVRIPEGNWYCPSCVANKKNYRGPSSFGTPVIISRKPRRKRYQRDITDKYLEALAQLANTMELKEYWEFNVEERINLLKFLSDEVLNSAVVREHLEQCTSASAELQQKLRTLASEWKMLKVKQEILTANLAKEVRKGCGEFGSDTIGTHVPSVHVNVSKADDLEASSLLKSEISSLENLIGTLESDLFKVSVRKELLGRDSAGRMYWVFGSLGTSRRGSLTGQQRKVNDSGVSYLFAVESPSSSRGLSYSNIYPAEQNMDIAVSSSWCYYQSDTEIEELVGWLSYNDARERELRETILHWWNKPNTDSNDVNNYCQNVREPGPLNSSLGGKSSIGSNFPVTNAMAALEKKLGPCLAVEKANDIQKLQGEDTAGRMYRCDCLEPLWDCKPHCLSCHQTFSKREDLDRHSNGTCSQVNVDSLKNKRKTTETSTEKSSDIIRAIKASKSEKDKNRSCSTEKIDPECPFDFEEVRAKFIIQSSLKDVVKEIGLIGSNGTPSFVPKLSPYLEDPALSLVPTIKSEEHSSINLENLQQLTKKKERTGLIAYSLLKCPEDSVDDGQSRVSRSTSKGIMGGKDQLSISCMNNLLPGGKLAIIHETSLRLLEGRASKILRRLKIILLDMDAALPEEAFRPSRANSEKRCVWRAFVKSAESIYEMSLATIVLEDMIKTANLRNDWWYWSSPSVAAKISTLSALALRICTLDAAIIYENTIPYHDPSEICKPGREESPSNSSPANLVPSSNPRPKSLNSDPADSSRIKSKSSKRRKGSGA